MLSERIYVLSSSEIHDLATMAIFAMVVLFERVKKVPVKCGVCIHTSPFFYYS